VPDLPRGRGGRGPAWGLLSHPCNHFVNDSRLPAPARPPHLCRWSLMIGPHHAAVTHVGDSSEVGQREHTVRQWAIKVFGEMIPSYRKAQRRLSLTKWDVCMYIPLAVGGQTAKSAPATGPLAGRQRRGPAEGCRPSASRGPRPSTWRGGAGSWGARMGLPSQLIARISWSYNAARGALPRGSFAVIDI
jgi:hypothetical protein